MEATDKGGRVKITFEFEINKPAMDLVRLNIENMSNMIAVATDNWREEMMKRRKEGRDMGMIGSIVHGRGGQ